MTLLVLELKVPEITRTQSSAEVLAQIGKLKSVFFAVVTTFMISGAFWFLHHLSFHFIKQTNRVLCWLNLFFLLFVSVLPFSATLWGRAIAHPIAQLFYFGNQAILAMLLLTLWLYARRKGLTDETQKPRDAEELTWRISSMAAAFSVAVVLALTGSDQSSLGLVIVVAATNILSRIVLKRRYPTER